MSAIVKHAVIWLLSSLKLGLRVNLAPGASDHANPQLRRHVDLVEFIKQQGIPASARILDVGGGKGLLAVRLKHAGYQNIAALDWQPRSSLSDDFLQSDMEYFQVDLNREQLANFRDRSYDVIICSDVLEHMENPSLTIREISRVVTEPGSVFITIPNAFNVFERARILLTGNSGRYRVEQPGEYGHISLFTDNILRSLMARARLRLVASGKGYCLLGGLFLFDRFRFGPLLSYVRYLHLKHD